MLRKGGDFFNIISIIATAILGLLTVYWTASMAFAVVAVIFALFSGVAAKIFRWPMRKIAIPLATRVHIGDSVLASLLGILLVAACVLASLAVIREFNAPAVRRIGQGLHRLYEQAGRLGELAEQIVAEGVGNQRLDRWTAWVWEQDMSQDDTEQHLAKPDNRLPAALFAFSAFVNDGGRRLMHFIYEGEDHPWFLHVYWLFVAVVVPITLSAFLITVFQLSIRRLAGGPGTFVALFMAVMTLALVYCLVSACYLLPYVSHPYHTLGVPFWIALAAYVVAGAICTGVVRANQQVLFSAEEARQKKPVLNARTLLRSRKA